MLNEAMTQFYQQSSAAPVHATALGLSDMGANPGEDGGCILPQNATASPQYLL